MRKKWFGAEQIVTLLRQTEVAMGQSKPTPIGCSLSPVTAKWFDPEQITSD